MPKRAPTEREDTYERSDAFYRSLDSGGGLKFPSMSIPLSIEIFERVVSVFVAPAVLTLAMVIAQKFRFFDILNVGSLGLIVLGFAASMVESVILRAIRTADGTWKLASRVIDVDTIWRGRVQFINGFKFFSYVLPRKVQERVFTPGYQEIVEDFLVSARARGRCVRAWLLFCLGIRTLILVIDCLRAFVLDKLTWMLPKSVRAWWMGSR